MSSCPAAASVEAMTDSLGDAGLIPQEEVGRPLPPGMGTTSTGKGLMRIEQLHVPSFIRIFLHVPGTGSRSLPGNAVALASRHPARLGVQWCNSASCWMRFRFDFQQSQHCGHRK